MQRLDAACPTTESLPLEKPPQAADRFPQLLGADQRDNLLRGERAASMGRSSGREVESSVVQAFGRSDLELKYFPIGIVKIG